MELVQETRLALVKAFAPLQEVLSNPEMGAELAARTIKAAASDPQVIRAIADSRTIAKLGGILFVRTIESPIDAQPVVLADERGALLRMSAPEAIEAMVRRGYITRDYADALLQESNGVAVEMADDLGTELETRLRDVLAEGPVEDLPARLGIAPGASNYLDVVSNTQVAIAYGEGRDAQMNSPAVVEAFPFWEYVSAGDARVRANHAALSGSVFAKSDEGARRLIPPCGFNCRCVAVSRGPEYASRAIDGSDAPAEPDEGWSAPPNQL